MKITGSTNRNPGSCCWTGEIGLLCNHRIGGYHWLISARARECGPMKDDDEQYSPEETARRMERGIRRFLNTPPKPHGKNPTSPPAPKRKGRPASTGRVHKGKTRS